MGYDTEVVRGYGYKINTYDLEYDGDPTGKLVAWENMLEAHYILAEDYPQLAIVQTGDSRAPMPNQAHILIIKDSRFEANNWQPTTEQETMLKEVVKKYSLHVDEGPNFFEGTYVI